MARFLQLSHCKINWVICNSMDL